MNTQVGGKDYMVCFPGPLSEEFFRVTLTRGSNHVLHVSVEARRSKQQWQVTISELPASVPAEVVFAEMEKALVLRAPGTVVSNEKKDTAGASIVVAT